MNKKGTNILDKMVQFELMVNQTKTTQTQRIFRYNTKGATMTTYSPDYLDKTSIFTSKQLHYLAELSSKLFLSNFLSNKSYIDKFGVDFIHISAQIEGSTYDKLDTQILIQYGITADGKRYSKLIFTPAEKNTKEYLRAIVDYYETGDHGLFVGYFIDSYKKIADMIVCIEQSRTDETNRSSVKTQKSKYRYNSV